MLSWRAGHGQESSNPGAPGFDLLRWCSQAGLLGRRSGDPRTLAGGWMFIMPKAFPEEFRRDVIAVARPQIRLRPARLRAETDRWDDWAPAVTMPRWNRSSR